MNRFELIADRIQRTYGVHAEWSPMNREYIVDCVRCKTAREAERKARETREALDEYRH